jgi:hypothetical protein
VPLLIRFVEPADSVQLVLGGQGARRMEVVYKDLSRTIAKDLKAADGARRGGIDYIVVQGVPAEPTAEAPAAAVRTITFTVPAA